MALLDDYYQAIPRGRGQEFAHHPGALLAARVTLSRAARSIGPLTRKVYHPVYRDLHKMRIRELRDARELEEAAKDIMASCDAPPTSGATCRNSGLRGGTTTMSLCESPLATLLSMKFATPSTLPATTGYAKFRTS